ncbi:FecR domain-containing protein [Alcanivoracaceae bacterium MT1]|uniref:FecR domain-containing protein n=1 Tax=Alloalcanivorax xenomutans TaxID=1094342 RepID=UPI0004CE9844
MTNGVDPMVVREAGRWLARLGSEDVTEADHQACQRWRRADPHHEWVWQQMAALQNAFQSLPSHASRSDLLERRGALSRRQLLGWGGVTLLSGALGYGGVRSGVWQRQWADYAAGVGETRAVALSDGTRLVLNTDTAVDVRFDETAREILLRRGEILVTTGAREARPLRVRSGGGVIRPVGTRFFVRLMDRATQIGVFEGAVEWRQGGGSPVSLAAGRQATFGAGGIPPVSALSVNAAEWENGRLIAERMTVSRFVEELARYRYGLVDCEPGVAALRVTGVFPLTDTDQALAALARALPVKVTYYTPFWVRIEKKH